MAQACMTVHNGCLPVHGGAAQEPASLEVRMMLGLVAPGAPELVLEAVQDAEVRLLAHMGFSVCGWCSPSSQP